MYFSSRWRMVTGFQSLERTNSTSRLELTWSRTTESMMSSRRLRAPRSLATVCKKRRGSVMRQRAVVSTQMYFLSLVGIWLGEPSHLSRRSSKVCTSWIMGILKYRPACCVGASHRFAELGDDGLMPLAHRKEGARGHQGGDQYQDDHHGECFLAHHFTPLSLGLRRLGWG